MRALDCCEGPGEGRWVGGRVDGGARPLDWSVALRELALRVQDSDLDPLAKRKLGALLWVDEESRSLYW